MSDENSWDFEEMATQECDRCGKMMIECECEEEEPQQGEVQ